MSYTLPLRSYPEKIEDTLPTGYVSWITIYLLIKDKEGHILEKLLSWTPIRVYFLMLIYRWHARRLKRWDYNFTNLMLIKEKGKRKSVVKSAVTLRALDTFFSTTGNPSESSLLRKMGKQKDCFCLRMWRDLNKTLGVHFIKLWSLPVTYLSLAPLLAGLSYRTLARPNFPFSIPF